MLTLQANSACDVCSEDFSPVCQPHSIPCGHVLCAKCCNTIVDKTAPRLSPVCPFCREHFTKDSVRLIRIDFTASRWNTPRFRGGALEANDISADVNRGDDHILLMPPGSARSREEARRLEHKVAKVAAKKCSVEEVSHLHTELEQWLTSEVKTDDQTSSLTLSAALLRAILMNHLAHSEASKQARATENNLKGKLDDADITNQKLESELRRTRLQYTQKQEECQNLRAELSRLKLMTTNLGSSSSASAAAAASSRSRDVASPTHERLRSPTPPRPPSTSPTPPLSATSSYGPSPLSRFNSTHSPSHSRTVSMSGHNSPSARLAPPPTIAAPIPPSHRSYTPSIRSQTPSVRSHSQSNTPAPPPLPTKSRRLSQPPPPQPQPISRTNSEEKEREREHREREREREMKASHHTHHQRWIPTIDPAKSSPPSTGKYSSYGMGIARPSTTVPSPSSRVASAAAFARYHSSPHNAT